MGIVRNVWELERALARTTVAWGLVSMAAGLLLAAGGRRRPWWRAFGQQHAGWGAVDVAIALLAGRLQKRRLQRWADPYAAPALESERAKLFRVLWVNAVADAGYVGLGIVLAARRALPVAYARPPAAT